MNYFKWFIKEGWRRYALPFLLGIGIDIAVILHLDDFMNAPLFISILSIVSLFGFSIGITYHSILAYKASK